MSAAYVELSSEDKKQLDKMLSTIPVYGDRYSAEQESMTNR